MFGVAEAREIAREKNNAEARRFSRAGAINNVAAGRFQPPHL